MEKEYIYKLKKHYENYFKVRGVEKKWKKDPREKLSPNFSVLEIPPNEIHNMWCYLTLGMSSERDNKNLIELVVYSPKKSDDLIELLTLVASFHKNAAALNLHHTVNIGKPWLENSKCSYGLISLPYLDGESFELFDFEEKEINCYWFIPITHDEREYKIKHGIEALENLFEKSGLNFLKIERESLV